MVSNNLCPAVHISDSLFVYSRTKGIAEHYWPRAVFLTLLPEIERIRIPELLSPDMASFASL